MSENIKREAEEALKNILEYIGSEEMLKAFRDNAALLSYIEWAIKKCGGS